MCHLSFVRLESNIDRLKRTQPKRLLRITYNDLHKLTYCITDSAVWGYTTYKGSTFWPFESCHGIVREWCLRGSEGQSEYIIIYSKSTVLFVVLVVVCCL